MVELSTLRRREIVAALRNGTVPHNGLGELAVGMERFEAAFDDELERVGAGQGAFKAVRGEYGSGKTFLSRWLQQRAWDRGFATAEVQISASDTPLYRMETVYRRAVASLRTQQWHEGAFRALIDRWFFALEEEVLDDGQVDESDGAALARKVGERLELRLARISATHPQFAAALRGCHHARIDGDHALADGLLGWLMGQPHVGASIKRAAGIKGEVDHFAANAFLRGLIALLKQTGRRGLVLVLDEVETVQRMRRDVRDKSLEALRQLIDDVQRGEYPGLYVVVTGTPAFFDGPHGARRVEALAQRLHVDFGDPRWDNPRAVQIRLHPFDRQRLIEVGQKIRALYPARDAADLASRAPDDVIAALADQIAGELGGRVGLAPRLFLKKLVQDVLDKVDQFPDFDPAKHLELRVDPLELTANERKAAGIELGVDDIELDLSADGEPGPAR